MASASAIISRARADCRVFRSAVFNNGVCGVSVTAGDTAAAEAAFDTANRSNPLLPFFFDFPPDDFIADRGADDGGSTGGVLAAAGDEAGDGLAAKFNFAIGLGAGDSLAAPPPLAALTIGDCGVKSS